MITIPMNNDFNRAFTVTIPIFGKNRNIRFFSKYNPFGDYWKLNLSDADTGELLINELPMVPGQPPFDNLFKPYEYLDLGDAYIVNLGSQRDYPGINDWGTNFLFVWEGH